MDTQPKLPQQPFAGGWETLRRALPVGNSLSPENWRPRHLVICWLLWAHVPVVFWFALAHKESVSHGVLEGAILTMLAVGASLRKWPDKIRAMSATLGLVSASAILVHLSGGLIEMHFHFFVVVAVASLYQSWVPFLLALTFVVLHHGMVGVLSPESVYNHPAAIAGAWKWALVHGGFLLAESAACLVSWRLNESALLGERRARGELENANEDLVTAQRLSSIGSWDWDLDADTVWWSHEMYSIFGQDPAEFLPSMGGFLNVVVGEDRDRISILVELAANGPGRELDQEFRIVRPDGDQRTVHALGHSAIGDDGRPTRLLGTVQDITTRKGLEAQIEYRAFHDTLTGLANRSLFFDRVEHCLAVRERTGASLAVLFLDLDNFKSVNDTLGHSAGDVLLVEVAKSLQETVRVGDTVARLGGDEFALLLENTDAAGAVKVAEQVLSSLHQPLRVHGAHLLARTSIGIVIADRVIEVEELLRRADIAMYASKQQGKHTYRLYQDSMHSSLAARLGLEAELAEAIKAGQFLLHLQPVLDLGEHTITCMEALVRWRHPEHGILPPATFISVAEETGLIGPLGDWVLAEAIRQARWLHERVGQPIPVAVNLSVLQGDFVGTVKRELADAAMDPRELVLEITETAIMSSEPNVVEKLVELKSLGVRIALDDFGTGYSSLAYLKRLPIDILKIDRSFIRNITGGPEESALAHAIIKLARLFNLTTIAEGIETAEQKEVLRSLGCDRGQGYHLGRPVEVKRLASNILAKRLLLPPVRLNALHKLA